MRRRLDVGASKHGVVVVSVLKRSKNIFTFWVFFLVKKWS
jgi:uncharacterized protein YigE (DUF2233 family)